MKWPPGGYRGVSLQQVRNIPRQELVYLVYGMIGNAFEDIVHVALWIDSVEFACLDQTVEDGRAISTVI